MSSELEIPQWSCIIIREVNLISHSHRLENQWETMSDLIELSQVWANHSEDKTTMLMRHIIKKLGRKTNHRLPSEMVRVRGMTNIKGIKILSILIRDRWMSRRIQDTQRKKLISTTEMIMVGITTINNSSPKGLVEMVVVRVCVRGTSRKRHSPNHHHM